MIIIGLEEIKERWCRGKVRGRERVEKQTEEKTGEWEGEKVWEGIRVREGRGMVK